MISVNQTGVTFTYCQIHSWRQVRLVSFDGMPQERPLSFNLKSLMLGVILIGGIFAALSNASPTIATVVLNLTILLIMLSAVGGVYSSSRSFHGGFFVFATIYFVIITFNCIAPQNLITSKLISQLFNQMVVDKNVDNVVYTLGDVPFRNWERPDPIFQDIAADLDLARGVKPQKNKAETLIEPFLVIGHCSFTLLLGALGAVVGTQMTRRNRPG